MGTDGYRAVRDLLVRFFRRQGADPSGEVQRVDRLSALADAPGADERVRESLVSLVSFELQRVARGDLAVLRDLLDGLAGLPKAGSEGAGGDRNSVIQTNIALGSQKVAGRDMTNFGGA